MNVTINEQISGNEFFVRVVMQYNQVSHDEAEKMIRDHLFSCDHQVCGTGVTADLVGKPIAVVITTGGMSSAQKSATAQRTAAIAALPPGERKDLNDETDRRFWNRYQYKPGQSLGRGAKEEGMRQAWLREREGVIADQESVARLPPKVLDFLTAEGKRKITPEDYKSALRIAKKVGSFSDDDWLLYKRRVAASTTDFEVLEKSIDAFQARQAGEKAVIARLNNQEGLYQQVKAFKALQTRMLTPPLKSEHVPIEDPRNRAEYEAAEASLNAALQAAGFSSIADFDAAVSAFIDVFRKRAVEITLFVLKASEQVVVAERRRYDDAAENNRLFDQLAPTRTAAAEAEQAFHQAIPTPMQLKTESLSQVPAQAAAAERYGEKTKKAEEERSKLADQNPILKDPELRTQALNVKSGTELGEVLRKTADDRRAAIEKTRVNVLGDNETIFKLDRIVDLTRTELSVSPGSVYDAAIKDYQGNIAIEEAIIAIALGALGIGLGLLTFGGGTVAVLAGGAGLALGAYQAEAEWEKYSAGQAAAHTSFDTALSVSSEDPSAVWVAAALIGVGLDGAALASAFKAAKPAADVLKATGDIAKFDAELAKAADLSAALKAALGRAGRAENEYRTAAQELAEAFRNSLGRVYSLGLDPDVITKATKAAYFAIKRGITDFEVFLRELKLQKFAKGIDFNALTAEQVEALRNAFQAAGKQVAADAAKFSVKVSFKVGEKIVTFDEAGKMLLDGKPITQQQYKEIYKHLDLTHVIAGHGPSKPLIEVMNEANLVTSSNPGLSGKFASDEILLQAVERAKAQWQASKQAEIFIDALPNEGRAFARADKVPAGAQSFLPPQAPPGIVEIPVKRVRAIFNIDGSLVTIYPVGF